MSPLPESIDPSIQSNQPTVIPPHLLSLPTELLERILSLLCYGNAQSIQACRQACRTLNTIITQSQLVQYLERVALLGMYDPLIPIDASQSATLELPNRTAAFRAWEGSWNAFEGGHNGDAGVFWQERAPNLRIAPLPPSPLSSSPARVRYIEATIIDPDPILGLEQEEAQHGSLDIDHDTDYDISCGPWFISGRRDGINVRAYYSYLDLHGCLDGIGGGGGEGALDGAQSCEEENGDRDRVQGADYDCIDWMCIKVPVSNVLSFALSARLDLAVVISVQVESQDWEVERWTRGHFAVRPLRFLDGTPHPCAKVPTMRFSVTDFSERYMTKTQVLGDYLLLWVGPAGHGLGPLEGHSLSRLYLIAWKQGSITLLREFPARKYGAVHMISKDVLALVQLDPLGIELCRVSNMRTEAEDGDGGDGGATNNRGSPNDGPRMDRLCTLLLPPLRQPQGGTGARVWAFCTGDYPGHRILSRGPWPEHRYASLRRRQMFCQSTEDGILSIELHIEGWRPRTFEVIVRRATLLTYADRAATATVAAGAETSNGDGDGELASVQVQDVVGDVNASNDTKGDGGVPWDEWGPRATTVSDVEHVDWIDLIGEQRATIEQAGQIRIRDYNPYRIRQARASMIAKGLSSHGWGDPYEEEEEEDEGEGDVDTFHPKVFRRIIEKSTVQGGEWFEEDVTTTLPHLEVDMNVPGCRGIFMEQNQVLLHVNDIDKITGGWSNKMNGRGMEGFVLYNM